LYNYDGVGSRITTQTNAVTTNYTTNSMNCYTNINGAASINIYYDANGNMISEGTRTYSYDIENRMKNVDAGNTATYTYDALGRRIKKTLGANTIQYYFDGLQVIEERSGSDSLLASYVWGSWLDDIIVMKRHNHNYYYHTNTIGSVVALTDSSGATAERYEYDAFGKTFILDRNYTSVHSSSIFNNYTFTGREIDGETGLNFNRVRYYNPLHGQFLQQDPLGFVEGMNRYSYVRNMPLVLIDPLGMKGIYCYPIDKDKRDEIEKKTKINKFIVDAYKWQKEFNSQGREPTIYDVLEMASEMSKNYRDRNDASNLIDRDVEYYLLSRAYVANGGNFISKNYWEFGVYLGLAGYNQAKKMGLDVRAGSQPTSTPGGDEYSRKGRKDGWRENGKMKGRPFLIN
jgi:RHS repeat-associated protein